jgi:hypothetical protein
MNHDSSIFFPAQLSSTTSTITASTSGCIIINTKVQTTAYSNLNTTMSIVITTHYRTDNYTALLKGTLESRDAAKTVTMCDD